MAHRARKLRLVDVTEPAELAGQLDHRRGLPIQEAGVGFLFAAKRKCHGFKQQKNVVLLTFVIDMVDQLELMLRRVRLGWLVLGQQLHGISPHVLDLFDTPARFDQSQGAPTLFFGLPDISTRINRPVFGPIAPAATLDQAP